MKKWEYADKWALVTGASAGFGEAFATALAERRMNLVLTARRADRLEELASKLRRKHGIQAAVVPHDLGGVDAAEPLWEQATDGRHIHLLINNAGIGAHGRFDTVERERLVAITQLNCVAPLELMHLALPAMRERGNGGIINLGSTASFQPVPIVATYAASKAFVLSLSEGVWAENRDAGVRVLALCPGRSPTEFQSVAGTSHVKRLPALILTADQIVARALRALEKDKPFVVPGMGNYLGTYAHRLLPRGFLVRSLRRITGYVI